MRVVEVDGRRAGRPGADGDDDLLGGDLASRRRRRRSTATRVRVDEAAGAGAAAATWLRASWLRMTSISRPITCWVRATQVGDGDVLLDPVALAVQLALVQPGQVEHRLAQRLGRDRAGVDADPADHVPRSTMADPAAELGRRRSRPSGRRARSRCTSRS